MTEKQRKEMKLEKEVFKPAPAVGELVERLKEFRKHLHHAASSYTDTRICIDFYGHNYLDDLTEAAARIEKLEAGVREIAKGEGEFSRDQLTHATNTIESMKAIARGLIRG